jgi:hypothetical protein
MITTPDLIESLVARAAPVRPLRPPLARSTGWLLFAALILALIVVSHGVRPDLGLSLRQPQFVVTNMAALLTGVFAAVAAFMVSIPGRSRNWLLLPIPALVVWMSTVGYGCLTSWVSLRSGELRLGDEAGCFAALVLTGAPLSLSVLLMLRQAAPLNPTPVAISAGLAVAGLTATALSLFHNHDVSLWILVWSIGTVGLFVALGGVFGSRILAWGPR